MILVDKCDEWLLSEFKWCAANPTKTLHYVYRNVKIDGKRKQILLHREIMGAIDGEIVDHINGNGLDCRRENLRKCTHAENMQNRKIHKHNALGVKGVYEKRGKFAAQIRANGKKHCLGYFDSIKEAAAAYVAAAKLLHGDFFRSA